ncbi:hypothetical protein SUGI_0919600 [Cryptomeria japonica]|nr:hypothetical protein SUGI_0919600 [Cryptomeria japonica]
MALIGACLERSVIQRFLVPKGWMPCHAFEKKRMQWGNEVKDFLDVMLDLREDGTQLSLENIKAMLMGKCITEVLRSD